MAQLNERQQALYEYLEKKGDQWTTQIEIAGNLQEYYFYIGDYKKFHDSTARHIMTKDIQIINDSEDIQKIIISGGKGIKLSNKEEFMRYIKSQYGSVFRRLSRIRRKERKGNLHGQCVLGEKETYIDALISEN